MANTVNDYMEGFRRYDKYVDLVSIFESLFSRADDFAQTVEHFERFPTVSGTDGEPARPDFTVLFRDGSGLAAEIASVSQQPQALDSVCKQLGRYDALTQLPCNSSGNYKDVSHVDVLFLTPHEHATRVARRILEARHDNDHPYSPSDGPLIASFVLSANETPSRYVIEKLLLEGNGNLREGSRQTAIGRRLDEGALLSSADLFSATKVERVFMNDPIDPLYLATHLWTRLFAELSPTHNYRLNAFHVTVGKVADELQQRYGRGSRADVEKALQHLKQAGLCDLEQDGKTWLIAWHQLRGAAGEHDAARSIASRIARPPARSPIRRIREQAAADDQTSLF